MGLTKQEHDRLYRERHPDRRRVSKRRWYEQHREMERAAYRRRYARDKAPHKAKEAKRRAAVTGAVVTARDWRRLVARYRNRCAYCGRARPLEQDHVIPLSRGGRHSIGNLLPACASCNRSKQALLLVEWSNRTVRDQA